MKAIAWLLVILLLFIGSSLAVIYSKYHARLLFNEIQQLEKELDKLEVTWGQLQLEQTTLTEHSRVEHIANKQLGMTAPERAKTIYLKP